MKGRKFRRQHGIENYVVDFCCAQESLIIELVGEPYMNLTAMEYDLRRTQVLEKLGFKVLRFKNKMVFDNLSSVLIEISKNFKPK